MRRFDVYVHPFAGAEAVKSGWSWPGFFFTWVWAAVKGLWPQAVVFFLATGSLALFDTSVEANAVMAGLLGLAVCLVFGSTGNSWRARNLLARGYRHVGGWPALSPEVAVLMAQAPDGLGGAALSGPPPPGASPRRACPFCAEAIQPMAVVCRFCNREVPREPGAAQAWEGK
jgi:hypothetical protein